ncbi:MAG: hypothetical protein IIZ63_19015 [Caulobacteraceae bacterium]|nr:hypothetical protein [Caulobacteraceae bacterium]
MNTRRFSTRAALAVLAGAALAACTSHGPRPDRAKAVDTDRLAQRAAPFEAFMRRAARIDPGFSGPDSVAEAVRTAAGYDPRQLEAGMIAYAAVAALQEPGFVAGVRAAARRDPGLAQRLSARPEAVADLPGSAAALARAGAALRRQGESLSGRGEAVRQAAYTLQRQGWAKAASSDPKGRLAEVKLISDAGYRPADDDAAGLRRSLQPAAAAAPVMTPVLARGLALAALETLGRPTPAALAGEANSGLCVRLAKHDYLQCLASAGPNYEDVFCVGRHAMIDPGVCATAAGGGASPAKVALAGRGGERR